MTPKPGWRAHVAPGDTIEIYGQNCFLPRFPRDATVMRVGQGDLAGCAIRCPASPSVQEPFVAPRDRPLHCGQAAWARRYLRPAMPLAPGHIYSRLQQADFPNDDARGSISRPWRTSSCATGWPMPRLSTGLWPAVHIHDSLDETIWIFERAP